MRLETKHLIIRPPEMCDTKAAYEFRMDKLSTHFVGGVLNMDFETFREKFQKFCKNYDPAKPYEYSIILKESNEYIGYCGTQYCSVMEETELLYGIHSRYWRRGYVSEAAKVVLLYITEKFKDLDLYAAVNPQNIASEKILISIGFELHKHIEWPKQGLVNMYRYPNHSP